MMSCKNKVPTEDVFGHDLKKKKMKGKMKKQDKKVPILQISFVREGAIFEKANPNDAGYDVKVFGREIKDGYIKYYLGIKTAIPQGYYAQVVHRSSNSDKDSILANLVATIDSDFRGEWQARVKVLRQPEVTEGAQLDLFATGEVLPQIPLRLWENGEKALQVIIQKLPKIKVQVVDESHLGETQRGEGGFGSTGNGLSQSATGLLIDSQ